MSLLLSTRSNENEILLNTPNRKEILKVGPPQNSKCDILGRGAYGTVFKAIFRAKPVAVKIIKNSRNSNLQTMRNEANILGWRHPNIVRIFKVESTPNFGIVIMERFPGHCLQMVLEAITLSVIHRVFISLDILSALRYCHRRNLLHLDVKPQNVLISLGKSPAYPQRPTALNHPNGRQYICKLCDFGASLNVKDQSKSSSKGCARGTLRYMSPEALRDEALSAASDIYSLAITMWQMRTRLTPYHWIDCNEIVAYQVVKHNLRPDVAESTRNTNGDHSFQSISMPHHNCRCGGSVSSELSHYSLEHIRNILNRTDCKLITETDRSTADCRSSGKKANAVMRRRPFQDLSLKANAGVVRNLHSEFLQSDELSLIFKQQPYMSSELLSHKEQVYEEIYKSCWHTEPTQRPSGAALRRRLEQLL